MLSKKILALGAVCFSGLFLATAVAEEKKTSWTAPTEERLTDKEPVLKVLANEDPTTDEEPTEEKKI